MASPVEVCNWALTKLGDLRITALTDNTKAGRACNSVYEIVRDAVLRSHTWNFTVERTTLAPLSSAPAYGFVYQYQQPSDCIKVLDVDTTYPWAVEGRKILTDAGTALNIRYQKREEDPNQWDSLAYEAVATKIAYEICEELTQSNTKKADLERAYKKIMDEAALRDAQEQNNPELEEDDWVNARY